MRNSKRRPVFLVWLLAAVFVLSLGLSACGGVQTEKPAAAEAVSAENAAAENAEAESATAGSAEETETASAEESEKDPGMGSADDASGITEDGEYTSKEEVAAYIHQFGWLPENYISKKDAEALGWDNRKGNLWEVAPGKSIGGSRFGNYEGSLPDTKGRKYYECDIDYDGGYRNAKRIIFSNDGLVFYTDDHYKTFEQLY